MIVGGLAAGVTSYVYDHAMTDHTASAGTFDRPLRIPPLLEPEREGGRAVFRLRLEDGETDFGSRAETPTWGLNQPYLGPTLRARQGEQVEVEVTNGLVAETSTIHWHGMDLPAAMDGGPHQEIRPGETWTPAWNIQQPAATLWYHAHPHDVTAEHVYRGLAGMFILDDDEADTADLPSAYGHDDIPLLLQDRRFRTNGAFDLAEPLFSPTGILGDDILVNGTPDPYLEVDTERVRLRLANGSNARIYNIGFPDDRPFALIASDNGLLETPHETTRIQLSPGERAEIVLDVTPGEITELRSYPQDLGADFWTERHAGGDDTLRLLEIRAADVLESRPTLPRTLPGTPSIQTSESPDRERHFDLSDFRINDERMEMDRTDFTARPGTTERWTVTNNSGTPHNFHPHLVRFQVAQIDGALPPPELAGWKDTVYVAPGSTVTLDVPIPDQQPDGHPYMFHCHVLMHEDQGMMGQFELQD